MKNSLLRATILGSGLIFSMGAHGAASNLAPNEPASPFSAQQGINLWPIQYPFSPKDVKVVVKPGHEASTFFAEIWDIDPQTGKKRLCVQEHYPVKNNKEFFLSVDISGIKLQATITADGFKLLESPPSYFKITFKPLTRSQPTPKYK